MTLGSVHLNRLDALRKLGREEEAQAAEANWDSVRRAALERNAAEKERSYPEGQSGGEPTASITATDARGSPKGTAWSKNVAGERLARDQKSEEAIAAFTEAIDLDPKLAVAYKNRAQAYEAIGRWEEADADKKTLKSLVGDQYEFGRDYSTTDEDNEGSSATRHMVIGGLFFVGGVIATIVSYIATDPDGEYFLFWGAIIFGGLEFLYGLFKSASA